MYEMRKGVRLNVVLVQPDGDRDVLWMETTAAVKLYFRIMHYKG